jgi:hypothetical protein
MAQLQRLPSATGSAGGALTSAFDGSSASGLGVLLPMLMGVLLAAALGAGVFRVRHRGRTSA